LHAIIQRTGYEHSYTTRNKEALSLLRTGNIDLFTQNLMRCDTNGCEFYQLMQNSTDLKHIPVLIISNLDPIDLPQNCFESITDLYPHHYITTPFSPPTNAQPSYLTFPLLRVSSKELGMKNQELRKY